VRRENYLQADVPRRSSQAEVLAPSMINRPKIDRRLFVISGALVLLLGIPLVLYFKQTSNGHATAGETDSRQSQTRPNELTTTAGRSSTSAVSTSSADKLLQSNIDQAIDSSGLANANWGVFVMSVRDGRVLYARDANHSFIPASNMKLYTTAVALDLLGTDYRWRTSVYAASRPDKDGTIDGDLRIYGRGAPDLVLDVNGKRSSLRELADQLYASGVRRVRGNIVGDESYFRAEPLGDGWLWNDVQWYFGAEASALSIGGNELSLDIVPGAKPGDPARLRLEPDTDFVRIQNDAVTADEGKPTTIGINRGLSDNSFRIWGDFPTKGRGFRARLAVHQPALWFARLFRDELFARGIAVDGQPILRDARGQTARGRFDPQHEIELASLSSKSLGDITRSINKESLNLEAELVLRSLGKEKGWTAPEPDPRKAANRGDDEAGLAVIRLWLQQSGISTEGIALHDGSGLSRLDFVTPEATARLLASMWSKSAGAIFRDSLPIAGRDGTLQNRMRSTRASIYAKTGTLNYVNSLSGYIVSDDKEVLAFSIICNNDISTSTSTFVLDSIARSLANR